VDDKLKKRITMFYIAGVVNLVIGVYVLLAGRSFLNEDQFMTVVAFFLGFAALDFYFPEMLKKKWRDDMAKLEEQRRKLNEKPPQA
jgi:uncharacterized membrane protein